MREIETDPDWGVSSAEAPKFRSEILAAVTEFVAANPGEKVPYDCHEAIQKCIERYVLNKVRKGVRLFSSGSVRTKEDRAKLATAKERLITDHKMCEHCADELLRNAEENPDFFVEK